MQWATLGFLRLGVPEFNLLNPNVQSYMNAFFLIFTKSGGIMIAPLDLHSPVTRTLDKNGLKLDMAK